MSMSCERRGESEIAMVTQSCPRCCRRVAFRVSAVVGLPLTKNRLAHPIGTPVNSSVLRTELVVTVREFILGVICLEKLMEDLRGISWRLSHA